jgi:hypothetical protein
MEDVAAMTVPLSDEVRICRSSDAFALHHYPSIRTTLRPVSRDFLDGLGRFMTGG